MGMTFSVSGTEWTIKGVSGSHSYQLVIDNSANNRGNFKSFKIPYDGSDLVGTGVFGSIRFYGARNYNIQDILSTCFERQLKESNSSRIVVQLNYNMELWDGSDPYNSMEVFFIWYFYPDRICLELIRYASGNTTVETNLCFELGAPGGSDKEYKVNGGSWTDFTTSWVDTQMTSRLGIRSDGSSSTWCLGFMQHTTTEYQDIFTGGDYPRVRFDDPAQQVRWQRDTDPDGSKKFRLVLIPYVGSDISTVLDEYYNDYNFNSPSRPHAPTFTTGAGEAYYHQENYTIHGDSDGDSFAEGETTEQIVASSNLVDFTVDGATYKIKKLAAQIHQMYLRTGTVGSPVTMTLGYWKCQDEAANTTVVATVGSDAALSPDNTQDHDDDSGFRRSGAAGNGALYLSSSNAIILPANGCPTANGSIMFNARLRYAITRNAVKYYIISTYKPGADNSVVEFLQESSGTYWTFNITDSAGTSHYKRYNSSNLETYLPHYNDTSIDTDLYSRLLFTWNSSTPSMDLWIDGRKVTADTSAVGSAWNSNNLDWTNNRIQFSRTTAYAFPFRIVEITTLDGCLDLTDLASPTIDGSTILYPQIKLAGTLKTLNTDYSRSFINCTTWIIQLLSDITADDYQIQISDIYESGSTVFVTTEPTGGAAGDGKILFDSTNNRFLFQTDVGAGYVTRGYIDASGTHDGAP